MKLKVQTLTRLFRNPAGIALGLLALIGGVRAIFDPTSSTVAIEWPRFVSLSWAVLYAVGGLAILLGLYFDKTKYEAAGWTAFGGGALINALATFALLNDAEVFPLLSIFSIFTLAALGVCGLVKAYILRAGYRLVWINTRVTYLEGDDAGSE